MEENTKKRKEWVKNAAIIFLTVMLLLTFFSNTIMNYSLPEVATQYVNPATITTKVKGSGTVSAGEPYYVKINETRVVQSVAVKSGDQVEKGDVILNLEESESKELEEAKKTLETLELAYEKAVITGDLDNSVVSSVETGEKLSLKDYQNKLTVVRAEVDAAQKKVDECQAVLDELNRQLEYLQYTSVDTTAEKNAVAAQKTNLENGQKAFNDASTARVDADQKLTGTGKNVETIYAEYNWAVENKKNAETVLAGMTGNEGDAYNAAVSAVNDANEILNKAAGLKQIADYAVTSLQAYNNSAAALTQHKANLAAAESALANKENSLTVQDQVINQKKIEATLKLNQANEVLTEATKKKTDLSASILAQMDLKSQIDAIAEQKNLIKELEEKTQASAVTAPVSGTVTAVSYVAGETITPDTNIAIIQIAGKAYTMSITVTTEQAKNVSVGDPAEIANSWYFYDVKATLVSIKNDPSSMGKNKLLNFELEGDLMDGQNLSISVGQKSKEYELVVPNSAIREDNNGKFILTVESKPSPLGTRYIANRVDIEVLATDDINTAISAPLYGYEYVITTATKPVEAGKQVRLAEQ